MSRNVSEVLKHFAESGVTANNVCIDAEGSIIVDSLKQSEEKREFKVETTLLSIGDINVHNIGVKGNLICKGYMNATDVKVRGNFTCERNANICETTVYGDLRCYGNMSSNGHEVVVYGNLLCDGNCDADVVVQGEFNCKGEHTGNYLKM